MTAMVWRPCALAIGLAIAGCGDSGSDRAAQQPKVTSPPCEGEPTIQLAGADQAISGVASYTDAGKEATVRGTVTPPAAVVFIRERIRKGNIDADFNTQEWDTVEPDAEGSFSVPLPSKSQAMVDDEAQYRLEARCPGSTASGPSILVGVSR